MPTQVSIDPNSPPMQRVDRTVHLSPDEMAELFDTYQQTDFPGRSIATVKASIAELRAWHQWMKSRHIQELTVEVLQRYVNWLFEGRAPAGAAYTWSFVTRFLGWMERVGWCAYSPHRSVRLPKVERKPNVSIITHEEYAKLRAASANHWIGWVIMLGWNTGMSIVDCMGLRWGNVNLDQCYIKINRRKTGNECVIPFSPDGELGQTLAAMRAECEDAGPEEFVNQDAGQRLNFEARCPAIIGTVTFYNLARKVGLAPGKRFHSLRHGFVSMLANSDVNTTIASKMTGHQDPRVFGRYVHASTDALRRAFDGARAAAELDKEPNIEPTGVETRTNNSYTFRPNRIYIVKRGKLKLPDGTPLQFVKTGEGAEGKQAVVTPCDMCGNPIANLHILAHQRDVKAYR